MTPHTPRGKAATALIARARRETPTLVDEIAGEIRERVPGYSGTIGGERHRLISLAIETAITHFLDLLENDPGAGPRVDELFRQMGYGESRDGHSLEPIRSALRIAAHRTWARVRRFALHQDLPGPVVVTFVDALVDYLERLDRQVTHGYEWGLQDTPADPTLARIHLLDALLDTVPPSAARRAELAARADAADWALPEQVVVMRITFHGGFPDAPLPGDPLIETTRSPGVAVCDARSAERLAWTLSRAAPGLRIAVSWPVTPEHVAAGDRWASRAIDLVDKGVVPPLPIVDCPDHAVQLWLHSEPQLRRQLVQDLLAPLLEESPNSREILSRTMLAWLESRDSAPAIAAKLGVHPQTVRYRWKRVLELFGDRLNEPEAVITLTMLLKATVPMWQAGHHDDIRQHQTASETP